MGIAGGIVLFLIALRMIFPDHGRRREMRCRASLHCATGHSAGGGTVHTGHAAAAGKCVGHALGPVMLAMTVAWALSAVILLSSTSLFRILGERGLIAMERLMGMLLVMVSVQMLINGLRASLRPIP